jgi:hypothetical protein
VKVTLVGERQMSVRLVLSVPWLGFYSLRIRIVSQVSPSASLIGG